MEKTKESKRKSFNEFLSIRKCRCEVCNRDEAICVKDKYTCSKCGCTYTKSNGMIKVINIKKD